MQSHMTKPSFIPTPTILSSIHLPSLSYFPSSSHHCAFLRAITRAITDSRISITSRNKVCPLRLPWIDAATAIHLFHSQTCASGQSVVITCVLATAHFSTNQCASFFLSGGRLVMRSYGELKRFTNA